MKTWFTASLFFEGIHHGDSSAEPLWEEIIVLLQASDHDSAHSLAAQIGTKRQHAYRVKAAAEHLLEWKFVKVERVFEIEADTLDSGTEIFARFLRASEAVSLLQPFE